MRREEAPRGLVEELVIVEPQLSQYSERVPELEVMSQIRSNVGAGGEIHR